MYCNMCSSLYAVYIRISIYSFMHVQQHMMFTIQRRCRKMMLWNMPMGSMGLVYFPTFTIKSTYSWIGRYTFLNLFNFPWESGIHGIGESPVALKHGNLSGGGPSDHLDLEGGIPTELHCYFTWCLSSSLVQRDRAGAC